MGVSPVRTFAAASSKWAASGVVGENLMDQSFSKKDWRGELKTKVPILEGSMGRRRVVRGFGACGCCCAEGDFMDEAIVLGVRC